MHLFPSLCLYITFIYVHGSYTRILNSKEQDRSQDGWAGLSQLLPRPQTSTKAETPGRPQCKNIQLLWHPPKLPATQPGEQCSGKRQCCMCSNAAFQKAEWHESHGSLLRRLLLLPVIQFRLPERILYFELFSMK